MAALDMRRRAPRKHDSAGGKRLRRWPGPPPGSSRRTGPTARRGRGQSQAPDVRDRLKSRKGSPVPVRMPGWRGGARRRGGAKALHTGPQLAGSASPGPLLLSQVPEGTDGSETVRRRGVGTPAAHQAPSRTHLRASCWTSACAASPAPSSPWG